ncbi:hypothetical protein FACS1894184_07690 [Clostridia bacterium]|nr:hypothetical protein FACS1894184_07690 [Clostridia bacterium]
MAERNFAKDPWTIEDDYMELSDEVKAELVDGQIMLLDFPTGEHYDAAGEIYSQIKRYLRGKRCRVFQDFRVRLGVDIYRPDVSLICDRNKYQRRLIDGAPDLIVEVLSPSNRSYDLIHKRRVYLSAGVSEYWIVDLVRCVVTVSTLSNGAYVSTLYGPEDTVKISVLDDCIIELAYVFPAEL